MLAEARRPEACPARTGMGVSRSAPALASSSGARRQLADPASAASAGWAGHRRHDPFAARALKWFVPPNPACPSGGAAWASPSGDVGMNAPSFRRLVQASLTGGASAFLGPPIGAKRKRRRPPNSRHYVGAASSQHSAYPHSANSLTPDVRKLDITDTDSTLQAASAAEIASAHFRRVVGVWNFQPKCPPWNGKFRR